MGGCPPIKLRVCMEERAGGVAPLRKKLDEHRRQHVDGSPLPDATWDQKEMDDWTKERTPPSDIDMRSGDEWAPPLSMMPGVGTRRRGASPA